MIESIIDGSTGRPHLLIRCDWCGWLLGCETCDEVQKRDVHTHAKTGETICGLCFQLSPEGVTLP